MLLDGRPTKLYAARNEFFRFSGPGYGADDGPMGPDGDRSGRIGPDGAGSWPMGPDMSRWGRTLADGID